MRYLVITPATLSDLPLTLTLPSPLTLTVTVTLTLYDVERPALTLTLTPSQTHDAERARQLAERADAAEREKTTLANRAAMAQTSVAQVCRRKHRTATVSTVQPQ